MIPKAGRAAKARWWFGVPLILWIAFLFWGSGEGARYEVSWRLIQYVLDFLSPDWKPAEGVVPGRASISMYQLNDAVRRVAHTLGYAVLSALVVRFVQNGEPKLKRASLFAALGLAL